MSEIIFWFSLTFWSLFPESKTPWFEFASIPLDGKDVLLILFSLYNLFLLALNSHPVNNRHQNWHFYLPIATLIMLLYATVSMVGIEIETIDAYAMIYTLVLVGASSFLGYTLIARMSPQTVRQFLWKLTIFIAAIGILYTVFTFFSIGIGGVRSEANSVASEAGVGRVSGPLIASANGYFILLPALALAIQELMNSRKQLLLKLVVIFSLLLTTIGTGSRGGILCTAIFLIFLIFSLKQKKQAAITAFLVILLITPAIGIYLSKANRVADRVQSLESSDRSAAYEISTQIVENRDIEINFLGSGYGSYWSWYLLSIERDSDLIWTNFGDILYHPHSTFLILVVELGLFGLIYFVHIWIALASLLLSNFRAAKLPILNCGVTASAFGMFFDSFIFKGAIYNTVWWIFLFATLSINLGQNVPLVSNRNRLRNI